MKTRTFGLSLPPRSRGGAGPRAIRLHIFDDAVARVVRGTGNTEKTVTNKTVRLIRFQKMGNTIR